MENLGLVILSAILLLVTLIVYFIVYSSYKRVKNEYDNCDWFFILFYNKMSETTSNIIGFALVIPALILIFIIFGLRRDKTAMLSYIEANGC